MKNIITFFVIFCSASQLYAQTEGCYCATTHKPGNEPGPNQIREKLDFDYWVTMDPVGDHNERAECGKRCILPAGTVVYRNTLTDIVDEIENCGNIPTSWELAHQSEPLQANTDTTTSGGGSSASATASVGDITINNYGGDGQGGGNDGYGDSGYPQQSAGSQFNLSIQSGGFGPALGYFNQGLPLPPHIWPMLPMGPIPIGMPQGFGGYLQQQCPSCCSNDVGGNTTIINNNTTIINNPPPVVEGDPDPEPDPEDDFGNGAGDGTGGEDDFGNGRLAENDFRNKQERNGESRGLTALASRSSDRNAQVDFRNQPSRTNAQPSRNAQVDFRNQPSRTNAQPSRNAQVDFRNQPSRTNAQPSRNAQMPVRQMQDVQRGNQSSRSFTAPNRNVAPQRASMQRAAAPSRSSGSARR